MESVRPRLQRLKKIIQENQPTRGKVCIYHMSYSYCLLILHHMHWNKMWIQKISWLHLDFAQVLEASEGHVQIDWLHTDVHCCRLKFINLLFGNLLLKLYFIRSRSTPIAPSTTWVAEWLLWGLPQFGGYADRKDSQTNYHALCMLRYSAKGWSIEPMSVW